MLPTVVNIRVRYAETDQMGYVYHGNYPQYFEIGRINWLDALGFSYKKMESEENIMLPVLNLQIKYFKPAFYDQELKIITHLKSIPTVKIEFYYEIFNAANEKITTAETTLVFINKLTHKPMKCPQNIIEKIKLLE